MCGTVLMTFQSRNRDAFLFKYASLEEKGIDNPQFQSRNRDAFLFKFSNATLKAKYTEFQSRNRDAFLFKASQQALIDLLTKVSIS